MNVLNLLRTLNTDCNNRFCFDFCPWNLERLNFKDPSLKWAYCYENDTIGEKLCSSCKNHLIHFLDDKKRKAKEHQDLLVSVQKLTQEITLLREKVRTLESQLVSTV